MAFKREADSHDWLAQLKKRRISELFAEDIPEDEAILMKNGRFCCTVCSHRPIFDTAQMLAHHRQGKKHAFATEKQLNEKLEIENLIQKRKHDHYLKGEEMPSAQASHSTKQQSGHHPLLTAQRYEPTVKKVKLKPGERRTVLQLDSKLEGAQTIAEYQRNRRQLTEDKPVSVNPYRSKRQHNNASSQHAITKKSYDQKKFDSHKQDIQIQSDVTENDVTENTALAKSGSSFDNKSVVYVHPHNNRQKVKYKQSGCKSLPSEEEVQKRITTELYLQARGAGWKKSLDGSWIRDEDVEFDSDEEPPNLP